MKANKYNTLASSTPHNSSAKQLLKLYGGATYKAAGTLKSQLTPKLTHQTNNSQKITTDHFCGSNMHRSSTPKMMFNVEEQQFHQQQQQQQHQQQPHQLQYPRPWLINYNTYTASLVKPIEVGAPKKKSHKSNAGGKHGALNYFPTNPTQNSKDTNLKMVNRGFHKNASKQQSQDDNTQTHEDLEMNSEKHLKNRLKFK
jgi:hypothetical protein